MIIVNPTTRQFSIPGSDQVFGVTDDASSEIRHFQCPRYVGNNVDVAGSFVRINYRNGNGEIDSYLVQNITVDGNSVLFDWVLSKNATMYKGNIIFVMCVVGPDTKVKWHTTLGRGQVLEGLEPDSHIIEEATSDVIAQLIAMVEAQTAVVVKAGADQVAVVKTAAKTAQDSAVAEIEAKGKNVKESIPDDYTSLGNAVDGLVRGRAGAIVCEVEGSAVAVNDSSDNYLQGLRIFGRSTQDGTPTPDVPVEIVSVESPVVVAGGKNFFDVSAEVVPYSLPVQTTKDGLITLDRTAGDIWGDWMPLVLKKGVPYTISVEFVEKETISEGVTFRTSDTANKNGIDVTAIRLMYSIDGRVSYTFTPAKDTNYIQFYLQSSWSLDSKISFKNVQVEAGSVATAYEPYKQIQTVKTTHSLRGILVTSGGNYTDADGQQWVCDEVDLERGVYVQRIKHMILPSTFIINASTNEMWVQLNSNDTAAYSLDEKQCYCTHYPGVSRQEIYNNAFKEGFRAICLRDTVVRIVDNVLFNGNPSAFNAWIAEKAASGENVGVSYILNNPVETPLSETEIAAYRALHTNKPNTTILNDSGAHMKVEYAADTKLYIDNKLAALVGNT